MTTKQADKLIKTGQPVHFINTFYNERFTGTPVRRDRWNIYIECNGKTGVYDRGDLEVEAT